jgi:hypothetical protein
VEHLERAAIPVLAGDAVRYGPGRIEQRPQLAGLPLVRNTLHTALGVAIAAAGELDLGLGADGGRQVGFDACEDLATSFRARSCTAGMGASWRDARPTRGIYIGGRTRRFEWFTRHVVRLSQAVPA